tara:strand:+ start:480 stop:629 length:150 start_codon:yes stop_codon:yes gene_type:complete
MSGTAGDLLYSDVRVPTENPVKRQPFNASNDSRQAKDAQSGTSTFIPEK